MAPGLEPLDAVVASTELLARPRCADAMPLLSVELGLRGEQAYGGQGGFAWAETGDSAVSVFLRCICTRVDDLDEVDPRLTGGGV